MRLIIWEVSQSLCISMSAYALRGYQHTYDWWDLSCGRSRRMLWTWMILWIMPEEFVSRHGWHSLYWAGFAEIVDMLTSVCTKRLPAIYVDDKCGRFAEFVNTVLVSMCMRDEVASKQAANSRFTVRCLKKLSDVLQQLQRQHDSWVLSSFNVMAQVVRRNLIKPCNQQGLYNIWPGVRTVCGTHACSPIRTVLRWQRFECVFTSVYLVFTSVLRLAAEQVMQTEQRGTG